MTERSCQLTVEPYVDRMAWFVITLHVAVGSGVTYLPISAAEHDSTSTSWNGHAQYPGELALLMTHNCCPVHSCCAGARGGGGVSNNPLKITP